MSEDPPSPRCIHPFGKCRSLGLGISECECGQVFIFVEGVGCGRYKKVQDITPADARNFSPEMEAEFLRFVGRPLA